MRRQSLRLGQQATDLLHEHIARAFVFEIAHDLGDAEDPHGDNDEIDAITQGSNAKGEALRARGEVGADEAQQEAKQHHAEAP